MLLRCGKGGVASGEELLAVAETLAAARRLRRQIDEPELRPACSALIDTMVTLPELEQRLKFALEEGGRIADRASAPLRVCVGNGTACARNAGTSCRTCCVAWHRFSRTA